MTLVGRTFGKYRLVERLGSGAFSDVYRGLQIGLERAVVVKILPPALAADAELRERFRRSGLTTARLSHPNIVTIFDSGEQDGVPYTVMEQLSQETLEDRGPLPWTDGLKVAHDLTKALVYAHDRGICHGDLTPASVKFDQRNNALITDFARAAGDRSPADDLAALGALLEEAVADAPPELAGLIKGVSGFADARSLYAELKNVELRLRARHVSRALAALPAPVEDEPPMPVSDSADSLGFLESLSTILSDDSGRRDVARVFGWAAPVFLLTLCCALLLVQ